jgi:hypothetical protein
MGWRKKLRFSGAWGYWSFSTRQNFRSLGPTVPIREKVFPSRGAQRRITGWLYFARGR